MLLIKISGQAEGWWRLTPMSQNISPVVEVGPTWSGPTFSPCVFAGELNQLPAIDGGKDEEMMYVSISPTWCISLVVFGNHRSHGCFPAVFDGLEFPALPFFFQKDRFYGATIFQASSGVVFGNTNPQPQRPPKQPNYQDFLAARRILRERKTWQKTCIKKCVIEFLYSSSDFWWLGWHVFLWRNGRILLLSMWDATTKQQTVWLNPFKWIEESRLVNTWSKMPKGIDVRRNAFFELGGLLIRRANQKGPWDLAQGV